MERTLIDKPIGFNLWDEQYINQGQLEQFGGVFMSLNFISVTPGVSYYITVPSRETISSVGIFLALYDANKQLISCKRYFSIGSESVNPVPANVHFIKFGIYNSYYGTTYQNDICINISQPDTSTHPCNGDYVQYGYNYDGTPIQQTEYIVLETCGQVDLGTLNWSYSGGRFHVAIVGMKELPSRNTNHYIPSYPGSTTGDDRTSFNNEGGLFIYDSRYTDPAAFKQSLQGVILTYELANPKPYAVKNVITI